MTYNNKTRGFTLIELSIVLVIIGLLVGGILVGRDLIRAAEIRATVSEIEKIKSAINTFRLKFNCIPGDCANATDYFPAAVNGNGNGQIAGFPNTDLGELSQAWYQLGQAQLVAGNFNGVNTGRHVIPGVNAPASVLGLKIGYTLEYWGGYGNGDVNEWTPCAACKFYSHVLILGASPSGNETYEAAFSPQTAYNIDIKIDDGLPGTGTIIAPFPGVLPGCATTPNPPTAIYTLTSTALTCSLLIGNLF